MVEQFEFPVRPDEPGDAEAGQPTRREPAAPEEPPEPERAAPAKQAPDDAADSGVMEALLKRMEAAEAGASQQSAKLAKAASDNERLASANERLASDIARHESDIARLKAWAREHRSP